MYSHNISEIIEESCKKWGIEYTSHFIKHRTSDAIKLAEIYQSLKTIVKDLEVIEQRHNINGLSLLFHRNIIILDKIDHDLIKLSKKMREENDN